MAGLTHTVTTFTEEDIALVKKARQGRLLKALAFALAMVALLYYTANFVFQSGPTFIMVGMFMLVLVLDVGIMLKEGRDLGRALANGKKDIYSGIVLTTFKNERRRYRGWGDDYYVVMKDEKHERKQHKKKMHEIGDAFEKTGDKALLDQYEKMAETVPDNDRIKIAYEDYEKIKEGDRLEFHCIKEVYLGSKIFKLAGISEAEEISGANYFRLRLEVKN